MEHRIGTSLFYPTFNVDIEEGAWRIIPDMNLPFNYRELVPRFYERGGKERVERYSERLWKICEKGHFGVTEMSLRWDGKKGLTNISLSGHSGLDLYTGSGLVCFQEHNIGTGTGLIGGAIIMKYVSELLKTNE